MTLSTVHPYAETRVTNQGGRAVVVGGSVAGLLAARVLTDAFEEVIVLDSDSFPNEPTNRAGVPQDQQSHLLHEAGRSIIQDLLPEYGGELLGSGGLLLDYGKDFDFYSAGDYLADSESHLPVYLASRPLYEQILRRLVSTLDRVEFRPDSLCTDYLLDDSGTMVDGIEIQDRAASRELSADLVVDATGRTSRTPAWLDANGFTSPVTDRVHIDLAYCSTYIERPADSRQAFYALPEAPRTRGSLVHPVEGGRWIMTLIGMHGDHPPTDPDEYAMFAESLPVPEPERLLQAHSWGSEGIHKHPFPFHQRHRYEDLDEFPKSLIVIGDAVTSFNPVYAQGMSVAALEALQLHHALAVRKENDLAPYFFERAADIIDIAWNMAVGADMEYEQTEGPEPPSSDLLDRYTAFVNRTAHSNTTVSEAVHRVIRLEKHPASLLRPGIVWRVLTPDWLV